MNIIEIMVKIDEKTVKRPFSQYFGQNTEVILIVKDVQTATHEVIITLSYGWKIQHLYEAINRICIKFNEEYNLVITEIVITQMRLIGLN